MELTKIATALLFLAPAYLSAATQDFTYRNGYKITVDQVSPDVNIQIKNNKPTQSITAPNSNGISHNYFSEFNVGKRGLNIDNAPSARVIINEVTGTNISQLKGKTAIIGKQASLVIANPNGINCNNCAVSNVSHLTLLAGNTVPDVTTGKLTGFKNITNDVIVNNVKKDTIKNKLTLTGKNIELNNSYINSPETKINIGMDVIDFSDKLKYQITDVNLTKEKKDYTVYTRPLLSIGDNTEIRGKLVINADNAALINNGSIISTNTRLNLMNSELSNNGYLKSSEIDINAKDATISNNKKFHANRLNVNYMGDFKINNHNESDSDSLSIDNILINSLNVKQNIQRGPDEYTYSLRDNSLIINNNGLFSIFRLSVTGNQYDNVLISNEGTILSDKIDIKASTVRMINNNTFEVRSELDVDSINGFYTFGDNKILVSNKILNM